MFVKNIFLLIILFKNNEIIEDFLCINGKNPNSLNNKEYLKEFSKGPCNPVITIPGVMGSRLEIHIKCEIAKINFPEIFEACGFTGCGLYDIKPNKYYNIWIPSLFSTEGIFSLTNDTKCFNSLIKNYRNRKNLENKNIGIKVQVHGVDKHSAGRGRCGFNAIQNLMSSINDTLGKNIPKKETHGFVKINEQFIKMGYRIGITYQPLPYDFRLSYKKNSLNKIFKKNLKRLHDFTFKKVILIGHSMGNMNIKHQLGKLSQKEKNKYIGNWISIAAPFLGSTQVLLKFLGLDNMLNLGGYGISDSTFMKILQSFESLYELFPKDFIKLYKNEKFFKWVKNFNKNNNSNLYGRNIFPSLEKKCYNNFAQNYLKCYLNLFEYKKEPFLEVEGNKYDFTKIKEYFLENIGNNLDRKFYKKLNQNQLLEYKNPGVPMTILYLNAIETPTNFKFKYNLEKIKKKMKLENLNKWKFINKKDGDGDGTVNTFSTLIPGIKFAYEFENSSNKDKNNKVYPVKFVEICSFQNNVKNSIYDNYDNKKGKFYDKNQYYSILCDSMYKKNLNESNHAKIVSDSYLVKFLKSTVQLNENINKFEYINYIKKKKEEYFINYSEDHCVQLLS